MAADTSIHPSIRAVIFDLDGCLVDSERMSLAALATEMSAAGLSVTPDDLRKQFLGVSIQTIRDHVATATGHPCPPGFVARFEERLLDSYAVQGLALIDGVPELLQGLRDAGIATAIATGGSVTRMTATLRIAGLADYFQGRAFSADQVERGKPAPDLFLLAATSLGIPATACAVMEDSPHGIAGAKAACMHAVGFTGGSHLDGMRDDHAHRLREAGACPVLPDLSTMMAALLTRPEGRSV
ncbi:MAG: HAD family hydrolase [Paracoccus sp. (in: a-proteobacteria)]